MLAFYGKMIIIVWSIVKNYGYFFRYAIGKLHMVCAGSQYSPI